jgi:hypothetical protein
MKYKKGDILVNEKGYERKIFEVLGDIYFVSETNILDYVSCFPMLEHELNSNKYTLKSRPKEDWTPRLAEEYWCIDGDGVKSFFWDDELIEKNIKDTLGIFRSEQEAKDRLDKIKEFIKTL